MAVMNGSYRHPNSAYSQGFKNLIDSMLKVNPAERPDINQVCNFHVFAISKFTIRLVGDRADRSGTTKSGIGQGTIII